MARLSSPIENLRDFYPVVVIGSGYGGGIAASRLARAGQEVCLLERGKEFQPGEYPDATVEGAREMQFDLPGRHLGSPTGLYDFRVNEDINVVLGCGLGGTSLINANVSLPADDRTFDDARWPAELRGRPEELRPFYERAREMLKPSPYPEDFPLLPKLEALRASATAMKQEQNFYRPPINVNFEQFPNNTNHVGVFQQPCQLCGDCVSGCNHAAKNTTLMNYLPDAHNHGAQIFTQVSVRFVERKEERWLVHLQLLDAGREVFDAPTMTVAADIVILAAGTLGSTEILLRSARNGLSLSDRLGESFTGNGDVLAFGYNNDQVINGVGFGNRPPGEMLEEAGPVGPCISGIIDLRGGPKLEEGLVIEDGSIPGALSLPLPVAFAAGALAIGQDTDNGTRDFVAEKARELDSLLRGAYRGAIHNTQTYLVMSHDDSAGKMVLDASDRLRIEWKGVGEQKGFGRVNDLLKQATEATGGTFIKNPMWTDLFKHDLVTVHPLGGCAMGDTAQKGVVNHKGQVFSASSETGVHPGLYVCDGAIVPRSLGVNPLLSISALSERNIALLAQDRGWNIDYTLPSVPRPQQPPKMGLRFTETMRGFFSTEVLDDYEHAFEQGRLVKSAFEFTLSVICDDLEEMLHDENHSARMIGSVIAPALSGDPLTVTQGNFNLFKSDPAHVNTRQMLYALKMTATNGKTYFLDGFKRVHQESGLDVWPDLTTLFINVHDGENAGAPLVGKGILHILPADFIQQMKTMEITDAADTQQKLWGAAGFLRFYAGVLDEIYGAVFARARPFNPDAPPRARRPLRAPVPEVHFFPSGDGLTLRLTRYRGGDKGPVMLVHGLGVSSLIFSLDTIETNMVEFLCARGFDVWLLDFRSSIDLPASRTRYTADDIALHDYPAAVDAVRDLTGAPSVQVVAHCFGSTTFFMAMLAGLSGVRSAVASQIATHMKTPLLSSLKAGLHVPEVLDQLGVESLTAYVDAHANWKDQLFDSSLRLYPNQLEEFCDSPVCRRITFFYSNLYEHDQLNQATHDVLHEMFGVASIGAFDQLALMARRGHLVAADGKEKYLPHLERLNIPITFIHGGENACFLPESTEITYNLLRQTNPDTPYRRHVVAGYGHIDCIYGRDAARDVYPLIAAHLEGIGK